MNGSLRTTGFFAIGALFGVNIRAEILNSLDLNGDAAISKQSKETGYAYSRCGKLRRKIEYQGICPQDENRLLPWQSGRSDRFSLRKNRVAE